MSKLSDSEIWTLTARERTEFADFLTTLTPEQWDLDSLCGAWRVRDVVAHCILSCTDTIRKVMWGTLKAGGRPMVYFERSARKTGDKLSSKQLIASLRSVIDSERVFPHITPAMMLSDVLIHQQDVRRPLGMPRVIPADRLECALDTEVTNKFVSGDGKHFKGFNLRANDIDWSYGD
ncbi:MAG: maleylpyruvate isomerase family mycothiol-dependent enzyme, partial [Acidimicrobiia bacterium]|nr:maleylpyruvate isomerase family mycothiol-dependent enzyme [Acidimicrobiia bacterium]